MNRITTTCAIIAAAGLAGFSSPALGGDEKQVGVNLAPLVDWSTSLTFVDLMRSSRKWIPQTTAAPGGSWDTGAWIETDADGWPTRLDSGAAASTLMVREIDGDYPAGVYTVLYEGEGLIDFAFDATVISRQPGKMLIDVTPSWSGILMSIKATTPGNHVRNVRVIMPGHENTYESMPFHPEFLASLEEFDVLRFMDWQATNHSKITSWSERTKPTRYSQSAPGGVSIELMTKLCNTLDKDGWFCIPHLANDDYVANFASEVANLMDSDQKIYIEHSNEVWNAGFAQYNYASAQGQNLGLGSAPWEAAWLWHSQRSVHIFDVVDDYIGSDQLVRVMGSQAANWYITKMTLEHNDAWRHTDAVAIAPYFQGEATDPSRKDEVKGWSVDRVVDSAAADLANVMQWVDDHVNEASKYGIQVVGYEGGQHLAPITAAQQNDRQFSDLLIEANRSPRMRGIFTDYLERWHSRDVGPMVLFNHVSAFGKYGSWGLKETQSHTLDEAPKFAGTIDFIRANSTGYARADLNQDGLLDTNDIGVFIGLFQSRSMDADFLADGLLDNGDLQSFILAYQNGD